MKLPRDLSGERLVRGLCRRWGYRQTNQVGSHMIIETEIPTPNILGAVAAHKGVSREAILESLS